MMAINAISHYSLIIIISFMTTFAHAAPKFAHRSTPTGNSTWVYDSEYKDGPGGKPYVKPGLFAKEIRNYNQTTAAPHKINTIFSYGGSIEMYCMGSGGSPVDRKCKIDFNNPDNPNKNNMFVSYDNLSKSSTKIYKQNINIRHVMPIVDGNLSSDWLKTFNSNPNATKLLADIIAWKYCADDNVDGVQVDLEPFNIDQPGQYAFYQELSNVFQGKKSIQGIDFKCKNTIHPQGRYFSIFAFNGHWTESGTFIPYSDTKWQKIAGILKNNGYFILSGYDLGYDLTPFNKPDQYSKYLRESIFALQNAASKYNFNYMVGIPASASTKEFWQKCTWKSETSCANPQYTGYKQADYLKSAFSVINALGIKSDPHYIGTSVWAWNTYMAYPPHSNNICQPNKPMGDVIPMLRKNL